MKFTLFIFAFIATCWILERCDLKWPSRWWFLVSIAVAVIFTWVLMITWFLPGAMGYGP